MSVTFEKPNACLLNNSIKLFISFKKKSTYILMEVYINYNLFKAALQPDLTVIRILRDG